MGTRKKRAASAIAVCMLSCAFVFCLWKFLKLGPIGPAVTIIVAVLAPSIFKMAVQPSFPEGHTDNPEKGPDFLGKD